MFHKHYWEEMGRVQDTTMPHLSMLTWTWTLFQCRRNMKGCWRFKLEPYDTPVQNAERSTT